MLTRWMFLTVISVAAAAAGETAGTAVAAPGSGPSVAYRNEATKRFEAPTEATVKEMTARAGAEGPVQAVEELAALGLREEAVAVRAGGVKLRLRGGLRSTLLAEEREGRIVLTCEGAPAAGEVAPVALSDERAEVRP